MARSIYMLDIFSYKGSITRLQFWQTVGMSCLTYFVSCVWIGFCGAIAKRGLPLFGFAALLGAVACLAAAYVSVGGYVKRLRGLGRSPWCALFLLIPVVGLLGLLVYCGCFKGKGQRL